MRGAAQTNKQTHTRTLQLIDSVSQEAGLVKRPIIVMLEICSHDFYNDGSNLGFPREAGSQKTLIIQLAFPRPDLEY